MHALSERSRRKFGGLRAGLLRKKVISVQSATPPPDLSIPETPDSGLEKPSDDLSSTPPTVVSHTPQLNVFSRLQALLPSKTLNTPPSSVLPVIPSHHAPIPNALKVRIVSWNMHDSLPSGDLEQLLGEIPPYNPSSFDGEQRIPDFGETDSHPYHILVVAGQECPSISGLPMAFGAGYRFLDKEKRPEKKTDGKAASPSHPNHLQPVSPEPAISSSSNQFSSTSDLTANIYNTPHPGGWSYLLDDWLVHGNKNPRRKHSAPNPTGPTSQSVASENDGPPTPFSSSPPSMGALGDVSDFLAPPMPSREGMARSITEPAGDFAVLSRPKTKRSGTHIGGPTPSSSMPAAASGNVGPYELAVKERMMGIYLAVYVHRDVKPLLKGTDKDAVTAGLIGGRVGNKGGVGISLNLDGTTFLFINAHLAAHEKRVQARMANLAKIKAELSLETFLPPDDPRVFAEEITDRYDHSFIFGDLNFRLDVSRLHADWLITRKEYAQALEFDQLRTLMKRQEFPDFKEAHIDFAPTFKYDVEGSDKISRRTTMHKAIHKLNKERRAVLREWRKETNRGLSGGDDEAEVLVEESEAELEAECEGEGDETSFSSTALAALSFDMDTSSSSSDEDDEPEASSSSAAIAAINTAKNARSEPSGVSEIISSVIHHPTTQKAKHKWLSLLSAKKSTFSVTVDEPDTPSASPPPPLKRASSSPRKPQRRRHHTAGSLDASPSKPRRIAGKQRSQSQSTNSVSPPLHVPPAIAIDAPTDNTPDLSTTNLTISDSPNSNLLAKPSLRPGFSRGTSSNTSISVGSMTSGKKDKSLKRKVSNEEEDDGLPKPGRYDTSSKKRVPSWCDRIIFKTTVVPPPDEDDVVVVDDERLHGSRGRRIGQTLVNALFHRPSRPSLLGNREVSNPPFPRTESLPESIRNPTLPVDLRPTLTRPVKSFPLPQASPPFDSDGSHPKPASKRSISLPHPHLHLRRSQSSSSLLSSETDDRVRPLSITGAPALERPSVPPLITSVPVTSSSPQSAPVPSGSAALVASPVSRDVPHPLPSSRPIPNKRWYQTLLNSSPAPPAAEPLPPPSPQKKRRRKGDVECLFYGTLDDQAMARLRGRSDHRPVIGVYSIAIG